MVLGHGGSRHSTMSTKLHTRQTLNQHSTERQKHHRHTHRQTECGVPTDVTCVLRFSGNRLSTFDNSFHHALRQRAEVLCVYVRACGAYAVHVVCV